MVVLGCIVAAAADPALMDRVKLAGLSSFSWSCVARKIEPGPGINSTARFESLL